MKDTVATSPSQTKEAVVASPLGQVKETAANSTSGNGTPHLTQSHVTQLRRVHQLAAAQLEKTDRELKARLAEVNKEKEQVETRLR